MNNGTREARYQIECPDGPLRITPAQGVIGCKSSPQQNDGFSPDPSSDESVNEETITVSFESKTLGPFRALVTVHVEGQPDQILDICAQVVDQKLELVMADMNNSPFPMISFDSILYGQRRSQQTTLINNGPNPLAFSILIDYDAKAAQANDKTKSSDSTANATEDSNDLNSVNQRNVEEILAALSVSPTEGVIGVRICLYPLRSQCV